MARIVRAEQNDTLDALVFRHLGGAAGLVEQTLALNRGLAARGILLEEGAQIVLPTEPETLQGSVKTTVQLWD
ncbi:MAG: tail protein X [Betaproteobacteria bacterium]|nr:tail protein X [Betaproteobacteria bacterium]